MKLETVVTKILGLAQWWVDLAEGNTAIHWVHKPPSIFLYLFPTFEPVLAAFSFFFLSFSTSFFSFSFCFLSSLIFSLIFSRSFLETTPSCFSWVESRFRRISPVTLESRNLEGESLHKMDYIFAFWWCSRRWWRWREYMRTILTMMMTMCHLRMHISMLRAIMLTYI